jgi:hypothetical protein
MQKKKKQPSEALYGKYGEAFNFTFGDLQSNRAGFITWRQKRIISKEGLNAISRFLVMAVFFFILGILMSWRSNETQAISRMVWLMFALVVAIGVTWFLIFGMHNMFWDFGSGRVQHIVRHVKPESRYIQKQGNRPFLTAGDIEFSLPLNLADFEWKDSPYRIFYLPRSKVILAVEEIEITEG